MKLVSFKTKNGEERIGLFVKDRTIDLARGAERLSLSLPSDMNRFLEGGEKSMDAARQVERAAKDGKHDDCVSPREAEPLAPVPHPRSCRDAYAFRQHVATARRNRGAEMIPEFDQFPVFYFTNHNAIFGGGDIEVESDHLQKLDFELEAAIVIGKRGKNISSSVADEYIAGYTIMNDFSARVLQMEEMKLNLGPAKGKDFATAIGPWLVTPEELIKFQVDTEFGVKHNLRMSAYHNGQQISQGNLGDMNWTFAEIIERASYGVELYPGDVIGSGTVGTGCYLELNGTAALEAKQRGETFNPTWLKVGDEIELVIAGLGHLKNRIVRANKDRSILSKKKVAIAAS
jgi:fumarylacetoacetate (FAA) hydrolase